MFLPKKIKDTFYQVEEIPEMRGLLKESHIHFNCLIFINIDGEANIILATDNDNDRNLNLFEVEKEDGIYDILNQWEDIPEEGIYKCLITIVYYQHQHLEGKDNEQFLLISELYRI